MSKDFWFLEQDSLPKLLSRLGEEHMNTANRFLKRFNLTAEQAVILFTVWETNGISQKELADKVYKDQANVTRIVKRLISKDLLEINNLPSDKRVNLVSITDSGMQFMDRMLSAIEKVAAFGEKLYDQKKVARLKSALKDYMEMVDVAEEAVKQFMESFEV